MNGLYMINTGNKHVKDTSRVLLQTATSTVVRGIMDVKHGFKPSSHFSSPNGRLKTIYN